MVAKISPSYPSRAYDRVRIEEPRRDPRAETVSIHSVRTSENHSLCLP